MVEKRGNKCSLGEGNAIKVGFQKNPQSCKDIKGDVMDVLQGKTEETKKLEKYNFRRNVPKDVFF